MGLLASFRIADGCYVCLNFSDWLPELGDLYHIRLNPHNISEVGYWALGIGHWFLIAVNQPDMILGIFLYVSLSPRRQMGLQCAVNRVDWRNGMRKCDRIRKGCDARGSSRLSEAAKAGSNGAFD